MRNSNSSLLLASLLALSVSAAWADGSTTTATTSTTTGTTGTTSTTTGTTGGTTATTGTTGSKTISFTMKCPKGGTRSASGSYDATSGALSLTTTITDCAWPKGEVHNGTRTTTGTILYTAGSKSYTEDLSINEDFTVTRDGATDFHHTCTITRKGSFDDENHAYTGTVARNCTNDGTFWDHEGWLENVMRQTEELDTPETPAGVKPTKLVPPKRKGKD